MRIEGRENERGKLSNASRKLEKIGRSEGKERRG